MRHKALQLGTIQTFQNLVIYRPNSLATTINTNVHRLLGDKTHLYMIVVGNEKGSIGVGSGKSKQVPNAIKKATQDATRNLIKISLKDGRTLHHDVKGRNGSGKVILRSAPVGTGIIAGGPIRAVCDVLGIQDIVAKSVGSANPHNVVKASVDALLSQASPKLLSAMRGKKISEIISKRENTK